MIKIESIKESNFYMYKLTILYILSIGTGVEISQDDGYEYHRCILFLQILSIHLAVEILGGSDNDIHLTFRLF